MVANPFSHSGQDTLTKEPSSNVSERPSTPRAKSATAMIKNRRTTQYSYSDGAVPALELRHQPVTQEAQEAPPSNDPLNVTYFHTYKFGDKSKAPGELKTSASKP